MDNVESNDDIHPTHFTHTNRQAYVTEVLQSSLTGRLHADATGRFPDRSQSGNQYVLVTYHEDSNYIHMELLPDRSAVSYVDAYRRILSFFRSHGVTIDIIRTDNETSSDLEQYMRTERVSREYVPPQNKSTN